MSLQMLPSFIENTIKNLSKCARRNEQKCVIPRDVFLQYTANCHKMSKDAVEATEHAEVSTTDFSDGSGQAPGSPDSSDTETSMIKLMKTMQAASSQRATSSRRLPTKASTGNGLKGPPGIAPPLGLDELLKEVYPQGQMKASTGNGLKGPPGIAPPLALDELLPEVYPHGCQRQPLNSRASAFVPSFAAAEPAMDANHEKSQQVRNSIRMLKEALEDWESGFDGPPQQNDFFVLQDALSRLSPQEATMISEFLESKEMKPTQAGPPYQGLIQAPATSHFDYGQPVYGQPPPTSMDLGWMRAAGAGAWAPEGNQRPFTSFNGSSRFSIPIGAARQQPKRRKPEASSYRIEESLSSHLCDLALLDSACIIMVRKINHLADGRIDTIKEYFAKFGTIDRVLSSPTRCGGGRVRPATIGFLVMSTAQEAQAVLNHGPEHVIQGVTVLTGTFKSHAIDEPAAKKE